MSDREPRPTDNGTTSDDAVELGQGIEEELDELDEAAARRNPDRITRREALELDLEEEGLSDEGASIGDEMP